MPLKAGRRVKGRVGDLLLVAVTFTASAGAVALLVAIAFKVFDGAHLAYSKFGLGFVTSRAWDPVKGHFGALDLIYGTAVTSSLALLLATPLSIAIALYLSELAPRGVRDVVGALVEMLAAVPSVIVGLWGILVLGPFVQNTLEPFLYRWLGFLPLFKGKPSLVGLLPATIVLTIMVVPIVASISRDLFLSVPAELKEGALALGMTRWEMVRGVVLPYARPGIAAAVILGLGRAVGEAIAVTQVIGNTLGIHISLFSTGDTLASRIASQYQGASTNLQLSAIGYLAAILLVITLVANVFAQLIVRRFEFQRTGGQ
jgi:phosphate transport system permease protein